MNLQYSFGSSLATMDYLFNIGVSSPPLQSFKPFSVSVESGSGKIIGQGWGIDIWHYGILSDAERAVFRAVCPGLSAEAYIRTYNDSLATPVWEVYRTIMLWTPEAEDRELEFRKSVTFNFRLLEKI